MQKLAAAFITLALIGAAAAAFVWTQEGKLDEPLVRSPKIENFFSPLSGSESKETATLAVTLREADRVDAAVVDAGERKVRTLASGSKRPKGRASFEWDGRTDGGGIAPDGKYRLRLRLHEADRDGIVPNAVTLDTRVPQVELLRVTRRAFDPEAGERTILRFRTDERSRPYLIVNAERAARRRVGDAGRRAFAWRGTVRGRPVRGGVYEVRIAVRDRAGNLSRPSRPARVRVSR